MAGFLWIFYVISSTPKIRQELQQTRQLKLRLSSFLRVTRNPFLDKFMKYCASFAAMLLIKFIKFYQIFISCLIGVNKCRFYPTCSNYSIEAIKKKGVLKGLFLTLRRILKCHPFSNKSGLDLVK